MAVNIEVSGGKIELPRNVVKIAPDNPTPSTIPKLRDVARIPDAIPKRVFGADPNNALLFGEIKHPIPNPAMLRRITKPWIGVSTEILESKYKPIVKKTIPNSAGSRVPIWSDTKPAIGAVIAMINGMIVRITPALLVLIPLP